MEQHQAVIQRPPHRRRVRRPARQRGRLRSDARDHQPLGGGTVGLAGGGREPPLAEDFLRLLEVAAVRNDAALGKRASSHLAKVKPKALAAVRGRFAQRKNAAATKRFEAWLAR